MRNDEDNGAPGFERKADRKIWFIDEHSAASGSDARPIGEPFWNEPKVGFWKMRNRAHTEM
jgi:hypothetical protein